MAKRKRRVIDVLRKSFPEVTWRYEWPSRWISSAGWEVQAFSRFSPRYEGDEDGFATDYIRSDTGKALYGLDSGALFSF